MTSRDVAMTSRGSAVRSDVVGLGTEAVAVPFSVVSPFRSPESAAKSELTSSVQW